jgi:hypothetical protein
MMKFCPFDWDSNPQPQICDVWWPKNAGALDRSAIRSTFFLAQILVKNFVILEIIDETGNHGFMARVITAVPSGEFGNWPLIK